MPVDSPAVSIVVPVLNEARTIRACLEPLQQWRPSGIEILVVDGGSVDATPVLASALCDRVIHASRGRARQMNAGAEAGAGDLLVFLHADTRLPEELDFRELAARLESGSGWGFFDVRLSGRRWPLRVVEWLMNRRSRLTGIGTGDQVLTITRNRFVPAGGFPDIPLMEDIAMSRTLKRRFGRPVNPGGTVTTSSRRWEERGIMPTVLLMWKLRLLYFLGVSSRKLYGRYYR